MDLQFTIVPNEDNFEDRHDPHTGCNIQTPYGLVHFRPRLDHSPHYHVLGTIGGLITIGKRRVMFEAHAEMIDCGDEFDWRLERHDYLSQNHRKEMIWWVNRPTFITKKSLAEVQSVLQELCGEIIALLNANDVISLRMARERRFLIERDARSEMDSAHDKYDRARQHYQAVRAGVV